MELGFAIRTWPPRAAYILRAELEVAEAGWEAAWKAATDADVGPTCVRTVKL